MATFSFDRQIKLSEEGFDRLCEILSEPAEPINIKPFSISEEAKKEREELLNKCFQKWKKEKMTK